MSSEGYWSNSTARLKPELACWRPFRRTVVKSGEKPRIDTISARPLTRCAVIPGSREIDSAIETSGSLPISSAETASTTLAELRLIWIEFWRLRRMPVTTIAPLSFEVLALGPGAVDGCGALGSPGVGAGSVVTGGGGTCVAGSVP